MRALLRRFMVLVLALCIVTGVWFLLGLMQTGRDAARSPGGNQRVSWLPTATDTVPPPSPTPTSRPTRAPTAVPTATLAPPTATPSPTPVPPTPTATPSPTPLPTLVPETIRIALANGFDLKGDFIIINQNTQHMTIVRKGLLLRDLPISTGDPDQGYRTPAWRGKVGPYWGTFLGVGNVYADNGWQLFKAPGGNILIHGLPYLVKNGVKQYKDAEALGVYPASNGCIRLLPEDAEWFTSISPEGMPVVILAYTGGTSRAG